jgi:hypothetical protein
MFINLFVTAIIPFNTKPSKSKIGLDHRPVADCIAIGQRLSENEHFCFER